MGIVPINIRQGSTSELIRERICRTLPQNVDRQMADTFAAEEAIKKPMCQTLSFISVLLHYQRLQLVKCNLKFTSMFFHLKVQSVLHPMPFNCSTADYWLETLHA